MGIIIKQSIRGSIWSYLGVAIGFITTAYLYPNYLSTEMVGLLGLLLSYAALLAQFSSLGINGVTSRLFPYFRDKEKKHNGYLFIAFLFAIIGFSLFLIAYFILSPFLVELNLKKSALFAQYVYLLLPLTLFTLIYTVLDIYNKVLYNAVLGTFLQEFFQRFFIFLVVGAFALNFINQQTLILFFVFAVCSKAVVLWLYLQFKGEINIQPQFNFLTPELKKEIKGVAFFSILTGVGGSIVFTIDKIVVNQMLGLGSTGIYTIAFFFGTLVLIPSRPLMRISGTLIADAWKRNDTDYINDIYKRSCINQFVIAAFLFGGIWVNIDNIMVILGPDYEGAKWVIFTIGLANIIEMGTGANAQIIAYSKHYKMVLYFLLILIFLVVTTMVIFIPIWGIVGAAVAIAVSIFANNIMRYIFIYRKYRMQPFSINFLLIPVALGVAYLSGTLINQLPLVTDILIRSAVFTTIFGGVIVGLGISKDINKAIIKKYNELVGEKNKN